MSLTDKQQRFIDEYLIDQNAAAAARRAGYSERTAKEIGAENLTKPHLLEKIREGLALLAKKARLTAEEAWQESKCIAKSDIGDIIDFTGVDPKLKPANEIPAEARRAIKSVKVKRYVEGSGDNARDVELMEFTFWDKPGQLNTTLRALGELKETVEHTGPRGGPIPLFHSGNVTHDPTLEAADIAYAESLARAATDSGEEPAVPQDGGPESVDHERDPGDPGDAQRQ